eukprot:TRINITY_DN59545_c0_g1_i1.p1 TRINITY_DN59545_c0_g1~~TRINITY_DN59545_c0_g1_i1.p1  ORF type:complete len:368 (-),score=70.03 TRINITY_DN59545_c0_g1_i1:191-1294(-)
MAAVFSMIALAISMLGCLYLYAENRGDQWRWAFSPSNDEAAQSVKSPRAGLNLPPTQGTSATGAFMPGVYPYDYSQQDLKNVMWWGLQSVRLPVNIATAADSQAIAKLNDYVDAIEGWVMLCMFGTGAGHGTGRVDDVEATAAAWKQLHEAFGSNPKVKYELFNEPFGYSDVASYYKDMTRIIQLAALPEDKCVIAGTSYSADVRAIVQMGWQGDLAYHFYPSWLVDGNRTQENFYAKIVRDLTGLSTRVWITEFGARLDLANYNMPVASGSGGDVNCLRAFEQAMTWFRGQGEPVKAAFHWHGWHNDDSYDFWAEANANGKAKILDIMAVLSTSTSALHREEAQVDPLLTDPSVPPVASRIGELTV